LNGFFGFQVFGFIDRAALKRPYFLSFGRRQMGKKIYVGNLPYSSNDETLEALFSKYGTVESAKVIMDRDSGRSKGFAFIEMSTEEEAQEAIEQLNEKEVDGRNLRVNEAKPQERDGRGGGGGGGGGFNRGGRGGSSGGGGRDRY
jgi:cold-inducible RNA-binding protein